MNDTVRIYIVNLRRSVEIPGGRRVSDVYKSLASEIGFVPVCALVNNKTEALSFPLYAPKTIEFLHPSDPASKRVYVRSLVMMLYRVVTALFPSARLCMEHSVSGGYYFRISPQVVSDPEKTAALIASGLRRLSEADLPFLRKEALTADLIEIMERQGLADKVLLLQTSRELYTVYYSLDGICDIYPGPLAPSTGLVSDFDILPYKEGFLLMAPDADAPADASGFHPQEKMFRAFTDYLRFNRVIKVSDVGQLNTAVRQRRVADLINVAEAMHGRQLGNIALQIADRRKEGASRFVFVAGPSSSGKTTSAKRLGIQLMTNLITPKLISLDDYFVDRDRTPRDASGDYDFESLYALDLDRFNSDLRALMRGETVCLPTYSFELGRRVDRDRPLRLDRDDVLVIEGIHGLNPELTASIPADQLFKVYVSALTTLHIDDHNWISTSDNRLLRRIVRDFKYRGTSALETIRRWPSVARGERKWIFPYQENADAMFNSSLLFEIGVMKSYAEPLLRDVPHTRREYAEAFRLLRLLSYFENIPADQIPPTSLLREFLGGSSFKY